MRQIDSIIIHCSATKTGQDFSAVDIDRWHRQRGFNGIGYHYVIRLNGEIEKGRDIALAGAHCKGWNERSIGICYIGGLDENNRPADTRTTAQKRVLYQLIMDLQRQYNIIQVLGHRDTSPDLDGDGVIESNEYIKSCPCFSVKEFMRTSRELLFLFLVALEVSVFFSGCRSGREVVRENKRMETDTSSIVTHKNSRAEQSYVVANDSTLVEEHIEETVFVFPLSADTLELKPAMTVRKTVIDRRMAKGNYVSIMSASLQKDSIYADRRVRMESDSKMEAEIRKEGITVWWKWGTIILLGGVIGWLFFKKWGGWQRLWK